MSEAFAFVLKFLLCTEYMFALGLSEKGLNLNHHEIMRKDIDGRKENNSFSLHGLVSYEVVGL